MYIFWEFSCLYLWILSKSWLNINVYKARAARTYAHAHINKEKVSILVRLNKIYRKWISKIYVCRILWNELQKAIWKMINETVRSKSLSLSLPLLYIKYSNLNFERIFNCKFICCCLQISWLLYNMYQVSVLNLI